MHITQAITLTHMLLHSFRHQRKQTSFLSVKARGLLNVLNIFAKRNLTLSVEKACYILFFSIYLFIYSFIRCSLLYFHPKFQHNMSFSEYIAIRGNVLRI